MTSKITINLDEFRPDESSPERTLFLCVILQALLDASKRAYNGEPKESILERDRAIAWFFASVGTTAEDFEEVCTNAGVDPDYMRDFAVKVLKTGEIEYVRRRINAILGH
jgi:glutaminase|tara:strand:- start:163 stop:492 length:330 start_codon:yes stop_codon:yes gene_type:complete